MGENAADNTSAIAELSRMTESAKKLFAEVRARFQAEQQSRRRVFSPSLANAGPQTKFVPDPLVLLPLLIISGAL